MPFDINSAVEAEADQSSIKTTPFDISTAQELNPPPKNPPGPIAKFLRKIFRDSGIEQMNTQSFLIDQAKAGKIPEMKEGEEFFAYIRRASKESGLQEREEDIAREGVLRQVEVPMTAAIGVGGVAKPVATAVAVGAFSVADHFFNARRWIEENAPDTSPLIKDVVEIIDFTAKGAVIGGGFAAAKKFTLKRSEELNLPKAVQVSPEEAVKLSQVKVAEELGITKEHLEASVNSGLPISVPLEKVVNLAEKPKWEQIRQEILGGPKVVPLETAQGKIVPSATPERFAEIVSKTKEAQKLRKEVINEKIEGKNGKEEVLKIDPVEKVIEALRAAKPVRGAQERLYAKERAQRMARAISVGSKVKGEKGFYAELGQLKGEMPKAEFEAIRGKLEQKDIDNLFNMVSDEPRLTFWEKVTARTALGKLFGEFGGKVPQKSELALLNKVFGPELTQTLLEKRPFWDKVAEGANQVLNVPRSIMSSFDLSAPLRQGVFMSGRKEFFPAFRDMFGYFASEKKFKSLQDQIATRPNYELMKESKLALTEMNVLLESREEAFMSNLAEKIPIVGQGIRASGRAYVGFLNKLRADVFDDMVRKADAIGLDPKGNKDLLMDISRFINTATGRGDLGALERSAVVLNNIFFSPRLIASRINLLRPDFYIRLNPYVRKEAIKSLLGFAGTVSTVLALAKLSGAEVGDDWRSSDFGKIKVNNTRFDIMGGFQQYLRMIGQLVTGEYVSSTTGRVVTLGEGYRALTRKEIIQRQIESKLSPIASFIKDVLEGQTWDGEKVNITDEITERMTPMIYQSLREIAEEDPELFPVGLLGVFGVGVQTYKEKKPNKF